MSNHAELFEALVTGNARDVMRELFPQRTAVSSAIPAEPQQPMCRYPDLVEGSSPCADTGTAGVSDSLESRERAELIELRRKRIAHERFVAQLHALIVESDSVEAARDVVQAEYDAIHGPESM